MPLALVAALLLAPAQALPEPATIAVPDVRAAVDAKAREQGYKFYYFHKTSTTFAEAHQDLRECRAYLPVGGPAQVPGFVAWSGDGTSPRRSPAGGQAYGLVGAAIGSIIAGPMERGLRSNKMRRCMETRGYARYPIAEADWKSINEGEEDRLVAMQAKLASGPAPADAAVVK